MVQTKFDISQSTRQMIGELYMPGNMRSKRGGQFTVSLEAYDLSGTIALLDIYMDRIPDGARNETYRTVDGTKVISTKASIEPDGERFDIEIIFERSTDTAKKRPFVRTSPDMARLMNERREQTERAEAEAFLLSFYDEEEEAEETE